MPTGARYNLKIRQGSTFTLTLILRHKIVTTSAALAGVTSINITPLQHTLSAGDELKFGNVTVELDQDAEIGDRTLSVLPIPTAINADSTAMGALCDLTGKIPRAQIRKDYTSPEVLAAFTAAVVSPGEIRLTLPSTIAATATALADARQHKQFH